MLCLLRPPSRIFPHAPCSQRLSRQKMRPRAVDAGACPCARRSAWPRHSAAAGMPASLTLSPRGAARSRRRITAVGVRRCAVCRGRNAACALAGVLSAAVRAAVELRASTLQRTQPRRSPRARLEETCWALCAGRDDLARAGASFPPAAATDCCLNCALVAHQPGAASHAPRAAVPCVQASRQQVAGPQNPAEHRKAQRRCAAQRRHEAANAV